MEIKGYKYKNYLGEYGTKMGHCVASRNFTSYLENDKTEPNRTRNLLTDSIETKAIDLMNRIKLKILQTYLKCIYL